MNSISQCRPCLGTYVKVFVVADRSEDELLRQSASILEEIERIGKLMSFHDPDSELSRINAEAHRRSVVLSDEMCDVLSLALDLSARTAGQYDLTVANDLVRLGALPDHGNLGGEIATWRDIRLEKGTVRFSRPLQLDLGGIAKGYAVDCGFARLDSDVRAVINAGGDLRMSHWRNESVEIRVPSADRAGARFLCLPMLSQAVATSSLQDGEELHPVISRITHQPLNDPRSISVFAPTCMLADALTKVVFLHADCLSILESFAAMAVAITPEAEVFNKGIKWTE